MNDSLHTELDRLIPHTTIKRSHIRMIVHALIDLGQVTSLECQWDGCKQESRKFSPYPDVQVPGSPLNRDKLRLAVDHIDPVFFGGSDLPSNLQIVHQTCNTSKSIQRKPMTDETRQKLSTSLTEAWASDDGSRREKVGEWNRDEETKRKRSESLKRFYEDPANRQMLSERVKAARSSPEGRRKASEAANKRWAKHREEAKDAHNAGGV